MTTTRSGVPHRGRKNGRSTHAELDLELSYHIHTNTLVDSVAQWQLYMRLPEEGQALH